ncbi:DDRGK domain-containing protein 1 [Armadillidium vulgare]|nr:DDRGK domain-containing protein 1 [Armadillidium vulgare]
MKLRNWVRRLPLPDEKIGKKKLAKLQMKAEKRAMREAEEREREEKKEREEQKAEARRQLEKEREEEEARKEEEERLRKEEEERREQEEYERMKAEFLVEEEGYEEDEDEEKHKSLLQEFVQYIKNNKVVVLEDLAALFKLKTQAVIDRIAQLQEDKILTGVIDDRGKFIYISQSELESVAKFIRQSGRVSLSDLAEASNTLINLNPETSVKA